ncbi:MAG TPA: hypothetical protein VFI65_07440 [Streptosporangiaceae bacterium]|nr:hypothetical protein [Streptosporangiaceae bacterium]
MATTLQEILLTEDKRPHVVDDCLALIDNEVSEASGVSGAAVKVAYKTASAFMSGYIRKTVEMLLPDIVAALESYWADFNASGGSDFGDYLAKNGEQVAESLLAVSDDHATRSDRPTIIKAYHAVRGGAAKHIEAALPAVGKLVAKYAA